MLDSLYTGFIYTKKIIPLHVKINNSLEILTSVIKGKCCHISPAYIVYMECTLASNRLPRTLLFYFLHSLIPFSSFNISVTSFVKPHSYSCDD